LRLLLDTHVAIWAVLNDKKLPSGVRRLIEDARNDVAVSAVTLWEIAIKAPLGRRGLGQMPFGAGEALNIFKRADYDLLSFSPEHALAVEDLPQIHADPFDRLLVAQAMAEPMRLVTHDDTVARYSDSIIYF
jgi:PIN domain nuclease of toxin-antitoxin system